MAQEFDIRDYGAAADGAACTAAVQQAIDACHQAGGGRVLCPGGTWLTGALELRSHVELHLAAGCRLEASPHLEDYEPLVADGFRTDLAPEKSAHSLLRAVAAADVALTGPGTIDGNGLAFYDTSGSQDKLDKPETPRPRLGMFYRCRGLRIQDVTFVDSACWTLWLMQCESVRIHRIVVRGNRRMRNVDGIDLDACRNVVLSDCEFDTEDDCIAVRAMQQLYDTPAVCENIAVSNCILRTGCQGVRVGCPSDGVIRRCTFANLVIESTSNGILFQFPHRYLAAEGEAGAAVFDIQFHGVTLSCRRTPIGIIVEDGIALARLTDLSFADFQIDSGGPILVQGSAETTIRSVRLSNVRLTVAGENAVQSRHCDGLHLVDVAVSSGGDGS